MKLVVSIFVVSAFLMIAANADAVEHRWVPMCGGDIYVDELSITTQNRNIRIWESPSSDATHSKTVLVEYRCSERIFKVIEYLNENTGNHQTDVGTWETIDRYSCGEMICNKVFKTY